MVVPNFMTSDDMMAKHKGNLAVITILIVLLAASFGKSKLITLLFLLGLIGFIGYEFILVWQHPMVKLALMQAKSDVTDRMKKKDEPIDVEIEAPIHREIENWRDQWPEKEDD